VWVSAPPCGRGVGWGAGVMMRRGIPAGDTVSPPPPIGVGYRPFRLRNVSLGLAEVKVQQAFREARPHSLFWGRGGRKVEAREEGGGD